MGCVVCSREGRVGGDAGPGWGGGQWRFAQDENVEDG